MVRSCDDGWPGTGGTQKVSMDFWIITTAGAVLLIEQLQENENFARRHKGRCASNKNHRH